MGAGNENQKPVTQQYKDNYNKIDWSKKAEKTEKEESKKGA